MPDLNMATVRQQFPQYNDLSDDQLAQGLHDKFYKDMPFDTFASKIGYSQAPPPTMGVEGMVGFPTIGGPQTQIGADVNALAQGAVGGTGGIVSGVGRTYQEAGPRMARAQTATMDAIDRGETVPDQQDPLGYQYLSPEQRAKARADLGGAKDELEAREPNALMRAGRAVQGFGQSAFPVDPALEGRQTGIARMIGGAGPVLAAGALGTAVGGPGGGILASMAAVGSQTYDATYQEAIGKGQTPEQADAAAQQAAMGQAIIMTIPLARIIPRVPMDLREGLVKTLVNLGQNGVEFSAGNTLGTVVNNYVAQQSFDPKRGLMDGTQDAALEGFVAGLVIPSTVNAAQRIAESARTAAPPIADVIKPVLDAPDVETAVRAAGDVINTDPATDARASDLYQRVNQATAPGPATEARDTARATAATAQAREVAAGREEPPPVPYRPVTAAQVQARDGGTIDEAFATAQRENAAGAANRPSMVPPTTVTNPLTGETTPVTPPLLPRIMDLLRETDRQDAQRPAMVPPTTATDPLTGRTTPITPPPPEETIAGQPPVKPPPPQIYNEYDASGRWIGQSSEGYQGPYAKPVDAGQPTPATADAVGADFNRDPTLGRSRREQAGSQADMEMADLMRTPKPGDARDIIPGATQTKAEIELDPDVSRAEKGLRQEFREGFNEKEKENNEIFHNWVNDVAPPREQTAHAKDLRSDQWKEDERTAFGPKRVGEQVSTKDVVDHMREVMSDPVDEFNSYLKAAFDPFLAMLTDADGNPRMMGAKQLYGVRQEMGRKVKDMATNPDLAHVRDQFGDLLDVTDDTIISGAPKYRTMMDNYRRASIKINEAERLQDMRLKITNGSDRVITFGAFDRFMKTLWMERHGPNRYAPAKDISQATWDHLMQLHERLARSASAIELAKTRGSDTTQLMMEMARKGMIGLAHMAVGAATHGAGNVAIPFVTKQLDAARTRKQVAAHLNPDLSNYPPVVP